MIVHTGTPGVIRQVTYDYDGLLTVAVVAPLAEPVPGGNPDTHVAVMIVTLEGSRAHIFAKRGFLARSYFDEKIGTFRDERVGDAAYIATAEALLREYERDEEDAVLR